ncbi:MAG: hypothetical protein AAFO07_29215, partial [Bacteroidota bacterium]
SLILILPSINILYKLYQERQEERKVEAFIADYFNETSETNCLDYSLIEGDSTQKLVLQLIGKTIMEDSIETLSSFLPNYGLKNTTLGVIQGSDVGLEQLKRMELRMNNLDEFAERLQVMNEEKSEQEKHIERLQVQIDSIIKDTIDFQHIVDEAKVIFPNLTAMGYAKAQMTHFENKEKPIPTFFIQWSRSKSAAQRRLDEEKLSNFLKIRADLDTLQLIRY